MKLQIDTKEKTIKVEDKINLKELMNGLKKLLPNGEWEKYSLETNTIIYNWRDPIIIYKDWPVYPLPQPYTPLPYKWPDIICGTGNASTYYSETSKNGIYNVDYSTQYS